MKEINKIKNIYFLGIGGIGMSALARYFKSLGANVSGYDKTPTPLTSELIKEGINVHFDENINAIPENVDLVVYTPAVPKDHKEFIYLKENKFSLKKRAEVLAGVVNDSFTIAVAGTHGKTTITSMIAHILKCAKKDVMAFIGGIAKNYKSNLILSGKNSIAVVEADEYDRSFLQLHPDIAVISAMDADHLDIYGDKNYVVESFTLFAKQIRNEGKLFLKKSLKLTDDKIKYQSYSAKVKCEYMASDIKVSDGAFYFTLNFPENKKTEIKAGVPGMHNVENAVAAAAVAYQMGVQVNVIKKALESYSGVMRRFDYRINEKELVFIDDYAHHPEEIKACLNAVRELYPSKKITGVFQPHLFSRTRDFADGFAESLAMLDECILLDIYPARELPIKGVTSEMLLEKIKIKNKSLCTRDDLIEELVKRKLEVLVTIGAGDIDQLVLPIEKSLKNILKIQREF
ncbi:MAG TPA: UDP-N-acetylmuramate--L-alanine ligase [Bacteroidales bacterium]|nr:UDP-N-acetylmuramate--L-alanine ligase [Bacteroidales bacterium]HPS16390.1 UDP-N-acetylmuramate--L-alanine ligase [Bacteroidales bacterium]